MDHCGLLYASFFIRLNFPHDDFFRRYPDSLVIPPDSDRIPLALVLGQCLSNGFFQSHLSIYLQRKIAKIFSYFPLRYVMSDSTCLLFMICHLGPF